MRVIWSATNPCCDVENYDLIDSEVPCIRQLAVFEEKGIGDRADEVPERSSPIWRYSRKGSEQEILPSWSDGGETPGTRSPL